MRGPFWGSPEEELRREYRYLVGACAAFRREVYLLRWLIAEARFWEGRRPWLRVETLRGCLDDGAAVPVRIGDDA